LQIRSFLYEFQKFHIGSGEIQAVTSVDFNKTLAVRYDGTSLMATRFVARICRSLYVRRASISA
jgi:hypothetical protein